MTRNGSGAFDLLGVDFPLVGPGTNSTKNRRNFSITAGTTVLKIMMDDLLGTFTDYVLPHIDSTNTGTVTFNGGYRLSFDSPFDNVTSVSFTTTTTTTGGNTQARMDNVNASLSSAVPLPAAG